MTVDNLYPAEPTILTCPTCNRVAIHDHRGCRPCRSDALDRLIDAVTQAETLTDG